MRRTAVLKRSYALVVAVVCGATALLSAADLYACTSDSECAGADQCRSAGTCDPATGFCTSSPINEGHLCNAGDSCTFGGDMCTAGTCIPGPTHCAPGEQNYVAVTDLGSAQGWSYATGINNNSEVVGSDVDITFGIYPGAANGSRAFSWTASGPLL